MNADLYAVNIPSRTNPTPARDKKDAARKAGRYNQNIINARRDEDFAEVIAWPGTPESHARALKATP